MHRLWQACLALMFIVPIVGWMVHMGSGNAQTSLVLISEIGIDTPEAYIFTTGYTIVALMGMPLVFQIFIRNLADMPQTSVPKLHVVNLVGFTTSLAWIVGLLIVAYYDTLNESQVHDLGAALAFFSLPIAGVAWARLDRDLILLGSRFASLLRPETFRILAAAVAVLVAFFLVHDLAHYMHPDVMGYRELGAQRGWFFLYAGIEWLLALCLVGVVWCFEPYFLTNDDTLPEAE